MDSMLEEMDIIVNEKMDTDEVNDNEQILDRLKVYPHDLKIYKDFSLNEAIMEEGEVKNNEPDLFKMYPHDLQMYKDPPTGHISLDEFESLGNQRLTGKI